MFAGENRKTLLLDAIPVAAGVKHFFLPADAIEQNPSFVNRVSTEPSISGQFFTTESGVRLFRGSIRDLVRLFPKIRLNPS